jgi:hypothetical protein
VSAGSAYTGTEVVGTTAQRSPNYSPVPSPAHVPVAAPTRVTLPTTRPTVIEHSGAHVQMAAKQAPLSSTMAADCDWAHAGGVDDDDGAAFYEDLPLTCEDAPHPASSASAAPGGRSEGGAGWAAAGTAAATAMDLTFSPPEAGPDQRPSWGHNDITAPYNRETGGGGQYHDNLMGSIGGSDHTGNTQQARSPGGLGIVSRPGHYQIDRAEPAGENHGGRRYNNDNSSDFGVHDTYEADAAGGGRRSIGDQQAPMDYDRDLDLDTMLVEEEEGLPAEGAAGRTGAKGEAGRVRDEHTPATVPLQYWDQLSPPWSSGSSGGGPLSASVPDAAGSFIRIRGVTRRIERFSTVDADGAAQFDVTVLVDDGHNEVRCAVSNHLVERFLDLTAADFLVMQEQLGPDKAARRAARDGLVQRFMHLHGLFWAYPRQKEEIAAAAQLRAASSSSSSSHQGKRGRKGDTAGRGQEVQGEAVVLIDFADEDLPALCREMLARRSLQS